jgi:hypothetical protein
MRTRLATLLCVAAMLAMALGPAVVMAAGPLYVATGGNDTYDCLSWGTACLTIQGAIGKAIGGETINVAPGTYTEVGQIVINKNLNIVGASSATTIIKPGSDTGTADDARGWFVINSGVTFNLSNLTFDGSPKKVFIGLLYNGSGNIDQVVVTSIQYEPSGPAYNGRGIAVYGGTSVVNVTNSTFTNIGRIGIHYRNVGATGTFKGNTLVGRGLGNWLDYGVEVGAGASATIANNTLTGYRGFVNPWTSAAILVTDYYGTGTKATITGNTLTDSTAGIVVGYDEPDASEVVAQYNSIFGNDTGIGTNGSNVHVDARYNWWGSALGPVLPNNVAESPAVTDPFQTSLQHEVGETGAMDTTVTANGVYGAQLVVKDTPALQIKTGVAHNLLSLNPPWAWDFVAQDFTHPASGQTVLAGTMVSRTAGANFTGQKIATWLYTCAAVGSSTPEYGNSLITGTLFSNINGGKVSATLSPLEAVNCLAATANSVNGTIGLQGRVMGAESPKGWNGAVVVLTCSGGGCTLGSSYTLDASDINGAYQLVKTGPGTGMVPGTYSASVSRRAYLSASKTGVVIGLGTTTISPTPTLKGGDADGNGKIEIFDLSTIGLAFGEAPVGTADTGADINGDNIVNIFDLVLAGGNFEANYSDWN